ncbi:MAG: glycoside hydrolase family 3 N-terminal domain-containing protein [Mucilaginibacter sp.]|uniref:glycoside hydrolase family 3 N-terminal domain-containing protein n=1 Tax=Mucilaginibacter sp. TaxID=1882438 RepID=UPI0032659B82
MKNKYGIIALMSLSLVAAMILPVSAQRIKIYHQGWVDLNKNGKMDVYENPKADIDKRIADLLSKMTIEEKTCQTATLYGYGRVLKDEMPTSGWKNEIWKDGIANIDEELNGLANHPKSNTKYSYPYSRHAEAINIVQKWFIEETRMGIPVDFTNEGVHGLNHDRATPLSAPIAIGSTWNKALVYEAGLIVGREAKALGYTNVYAPILDPARDPRWGRVVETYGEDPFLIAELGKQMTLGIQDQGVAATLKHFAVYSIPKGGRDGNARTDPHVAPREMQEIYLYPFRKVIQDANPLGVMSSYNDWDSVPITGSYYFLTELLRQKFGFMGYVVSDSEAVEFIYSKYHVATSPKDAVRQAFEAGLNVRTNFTSPETFIVPLRELVREGQVSMATLNSRVADVLRVKFKLGLFDQPYVGEPKKADEIVNPQTTKNFVLNMARQSLVLLKNDKDILPLDIQKTKKILVTGPLATATRYMVSRYGPSNLMTPTILDGIKTYVGNRASVSFTKGCDVTDAQWPESEIIPTALTADEQNAIDEAVKQAKQSDVVVAILGEDDDQVGEAKSRTSLDLPGRQEKLLEALQATGKPVILILINGQPLTINWANRYINGIIEAWFPNTAGGQAIAESIFGDYNPGGKLSITFPKSTGQIEYNFPFKPSSQAGQPSAGPNGYGKTSVNGPLYPFGYGLSYTTFQYNNLTILTKDIHVKSDIDITVDIKNVGKCKGDDVVQLYIKDKESSVITYESQLRGFERITLKPGETKTVRFTLHPDDLSLLDKNMNWVVEPGEFELRIGSSSEDIKLKKDFIVVN